MNIKGSKLSAIWLFFMSISLSSQISMAASWDITLGTGLALNQSSDANIEMNDGGEISQSSLDWC